MKSTIRKLTAAYIACLIFAGTGTAQPSIDIYYIAIGSGHYNQDVNLYTSTYTGFDDVAPAITSASIFADMLDSCKVAYGMKLLSSDSTKVSKQQIIDSTSNLIAFALNNIMRTKRNALLVFYYCGHGIMADSSNDLFLVPGDFKCNNIKEYHELAQNALSLNNLFAEALFSVPGKLRFSGGRQAFSRARSKLSFSMVFDCCYNVGKVNNEVIDNLLALQKSRPLLSSIGGLNVTAIADGLAKFLVKRTKEEYIANTAFRSFAVAPDSGLVAAQDLTTHPLLIHYAASPGNYALVETSGDIEAGPLCFRFIKLFRQNRSFTYAEFTNTFSSSLLPEARKDKYIRRMLKNSMR